MNKGSSESKEKRLRAKEEIQNVPEQELHKKRPDDEFHVVTIEVAVKNCLMKGTLKKRRPRVLSWQCKTRIWS